MKRRRLTMGEAARVQPHLQEAMVALDAIGQDDLADKVKAIFKEVAKRSDTSDDDDVSLKALCFPGRTTWHAVRVDDHDYTVCGLMSPYEPWSDWDDQTRRCRRCERAL